MTNGTRLLVHAALAALAAAAATPAFSRGSLAQSGAAAPNNAVAPADSTRTAPLILAAEDTLGALITGERAEIRVESTRVPLIEMIRKAQEGERRKYDGITTMAFTLTTKITMKGRRGGWESRCIERAERVYYRAPGRRATVPIRESRYEISSGGKRGPWDDEDSSIDVSSDDGEGDAGDFAELPIYLERLDKFGFSLVHRSLTAQSVLYEIAFEPLSDFEILPGGRMWLVSPQYQIVREEYDLKRIPFPWILKSVSLLTRDWQNVGGRWVEKRITARADLGLGFLPIGDLPSSVEAVALFSDYAFDIPIEDALFTERGK